VVLKLPELPPVAILVQVPPPEVEELELLEEELELLEEELDELEDEELELLLELEELLDELEDEEVEEPLLDELEDEELDELELLDGQMEPPPLVEEEELGPSLPGIVTVVELARLKPNWLKAATLMV
jgi:hypothetical protein